MGSIRLTISFRKLITATSTILQAWNRDISFAYFNESD